MFAIKPTAIEVSTVKLDLNGLIVELKVDDARKLRYRLDELFSKGYDNGKLFVMESECGERLTCNAYTGNTILLG